MTVATLVGMSTEDMLNLTEEDLDKYFNDSLEFCRVKADFSNPTELAKRTKAKNNASKKKKQKKDDAAILDGLLKLIEKKKEE